MPEIIFVSLHEIKERKSGSVVYFYHFSKIIEPRKNRYFKKNKNI